jgi:hypothetical protein
MIRTTLILCALSAPAFAGGPAWDDMVAETEPGARTLGAIFACVNAVANPAAVTQKMEQAGWARIDEFEGSVTFKTSTMSIMYAKEPGFCIIETTDFNTTSLTAFLTAFDIAPTGIDADGCTIFTIETTTATLTGGGNDPSCTSPTAAALRFEPAS